MRYSCFRKAFISTTKWNYNLLFDNNIVDQMQGRCYQGANPLKQKRTKIPNATNHFIFYSLSETNIVAYQCCRLAEQIERRVGQKFVLSKSWRWLKNWNHFLLKLEKKWSVSFKMRRVIKMSLGIEVNMFRIHKKGASIQLRVLQHSFQHLRW